MQVLVVENPIEDEESSDEELRFESKEGEKVLWYISIRNKESIDYWKLKQCLFVSLPYLD